MAQQITTADVYRGTFNCQTCGTELTVFYHLRCPKCHAEFTLLSGAAQENPQERTTIVDKLKLIETAPDACFKIDEICFSEECYQNLSAADKIYGEVYAYRDTLDRVIGYIVYGQVWIPDDNNAYISRIGVLPAYRRRGHAARMLHLAEVDLRARRCPAVHADIRADNAASRSLFEKAGYSPIWEDDALFDEYKAIRYAKPLGIENCET